MKQFNHKTQRVMMRARRLVMAAVLMVGVIISRDAFGAKQKAAETLLFGPTGIIGEATRNAIKVDRAQAGSPADGMLKKGDEIIGIGSAKFKNVKRDMAEANDVAETEAAGGKAALKLVMHKRQGGRAHGLAMLEGMPLEAFHLVAGDVLHVIADNDPTYHSYHNPSQPVAAAISILANLNIREGLDYALNITDKNPRPLITLDEAIKAGSK